MFKNCLKLEAHINVGTGLHFQFPVMLFEKNVGTEDRDFEVYLGLYRKIINSNGKHQDGELEFGLECILCART